MSTELLRDLVATAAANGQCSPHAVGKWRTKLERVLLSAQADTYLWAPGSRMSERPAAEQVEVPTMRHSCEGSSDRDRDRGRGFGGSDVTPRSPRDGVRILDCELQRGSARRARCGRPEAGTLTSTRGRRLRPGHNRAVLRSPCAPCEQAERGSTGSCIGSAAADESNSIGDAGRNASEFCKARCGMRRL